jgi:hypothetical protein
MKEIKLLIGARHFDSIYLWGREFCEVAGT